jgi:hypothetical protein
LWNCNLGLSPSAPAVLLSKSCKLLSLLSYAVCASRCYHGTRYHSTPKPRESSPWGRWHFLYEELPLTSIMWAILLIFYDYSPPLIIFKIPRWFLTWVFTSDTAKINLFGVCRCIHLWNTLKIINANFFKVCYWKWWPHHIQPLLTLLFRLLANIISFYHIFLAKWDTSQIKSFIC